MNPSSWSLIEDRYKKFPDSRSLPVLPTEFDKEMLLFNSNVDKDYREFVLRFGGGLIGAYPIFGLRLAKNMGKVFNCGTAPDISRVFREKHWKGVDNWLIFSVDHGGNPIGFEMDGTVWLSDQLDFPQILKIADDFEDFILKWCLQTRAIKNET